MILRGLAVFFAVGCIGTVWVQAQRKQLRQEFDDAVRRDRVQRAATLAEQLAWFGDPIPTAQGDKLRRELSRLEQLLGRGAKSSPEQFEQAMALAQLDRFAEAERLLRKIEREQPAATLLLANVLQAQANFAESDEAFLRVRTNAAPWLNVTGTYPRALSALTGPAILVLSRNNLAVNRTRANAEYQQASDGLAYNARQRRDWSRAKAIYREAAEAHPAASAVYHFQLGRTCVESDSLREAMITFETAARLDPKTWGVEAQRQIQRLRWRASGCQFTGK
jgi:tetratricopeptide (TPR) repeat protein